jgi:hypothetical protein
VQLLYQGMFTRIMRAYPLDYFGFWTPEDWTWSGVKPEQVAATVADLKLALAAAKKVEAPFKIGVSGWVLGPQWDRSELDRSLPKEAALGCINRQVGMQPIEPAFAAVHGREKWAMPWFEDDPGLSAPQLWAGRMRRNLRLHAQHGPGPLLFRPVRQGDGKSAG